LTTVTYGRFGPHEYREGDFAFSGEEIPRCKICGGRRDATVHWLLEEATDDDGTSSEV